jgi:hypothetical protein
MSPMDPRLLRPTASGDSDVRAYIAAVEAADTQPLEQGVKDAYRDFIVGCKADGIWDAIKASCILAGARTLAGALTPLKGPAPTNNGPFVSGDYDRKTGLIGNGTSKYLDTNRAETADPQDDYHSAFWFQEHTGPGVPWGTGDGGNRTQINFTRQFRCRTASIFGGSRAAAVPSLYGVSRIASDAFTARSNNETETFAAASGATAGSNHFSHSSSGNRNFTASRIAFYSIGEALDLAVLEARVSALITAIGAAI